MGKHTPLPSDPAAKAAEKKRRFKVYYREWRRRRAAATRANKVAEARAKMREAQAARKAANLDLIGS